MSYVLYIITYDINVYMLTRFFAWILLYHITSAFLYDSEQPKRQRYDQFQQKAFVPPLSCRTIVVFSFVSYNLLRITSRSCAAPKEWRRKQMATIIGKLYSVCQTLTGVSSLHWTSDIDNIPSLYMARITELSFGAVT